ncbi:MAG: ABC transporter ATP-binding protein, partial [Anaerolineae bacterium]|nr:ABC transporter ATP-binding protein [Anaerolineae bacterium]
MGMWGPGFHLAAADKAEFNPKLLLRALGYMLPYRFALLLSLVSVLTVTLSDLARPMLVGQLIDRDIASGSTAGMTQTLLLYLGTVVFHGLIISGQRYVTGWLGQQVIYDLRDAVFAHLQTLSLRFFDGREMGDTISRLTSDIDLLNELLSNGLVTVVNTVFNLTGVVLAMLALDVRMSLLTFSIMPLMLLGSATFRGWVGMAYRDIRQKIAQVTSHVEEGVTGVRIIQSFAQEERNFASFRAVNRENLEANMDAAVVRSLYFPAIDVIGSFGIGLVLWFGSVAVLRGDLTFGVVVAFLLYLFRFFQPIRQLTMLYDQILAAMAASERIFELLDLEPDIVDPPTPVVLPRIQGRVEFRDVSFSYVPEDPVLQHVDLLAEPGEMIALVGATGAGKTTTISLLTRFYDVNEGAILIDGQPLTQIAIHSLRQQLGLVLQEGFLFSGTIRDNIRYGRLEATDEEVEEAARSVGAHEFIMRMPNGYETEV